MHKYKPQTVKRSNIPPKMNTGAQSGTLLNDIHSGQSSITGKQMVNKNNDKDETSKTKQTKDVEMKAI